MQAPVINVLLIEDEPLTADAIRTRLRSAAAPLFAVEHVTTAVAAQQRLAAGAVDVVLLDLGLPDSTGWQTFAGIHAAAGSVPVVILSGDDDELQALRMMQAGAQDYLIKGQFETGLLSRVLRYAVERQRIEQTLTEERDRLQALIDALPDHIYVKDTNSRFILANQALREFCNLSSLIGKTDFDLFPSAAAEIFFAEEQQILKHGESMVNRESAVVDSSGQQRWVLTNKVPLRNSRGTVTGLVGINRDVTQRKAGEDALQHLNSDLARSQVELLEVYETLKRSNAELQSTQLRLIQAAKMECVGRLAAGVAHEVKNPLAILMMGVDYLGDTIKTEDKDIAQTLAQMWEAVNRADEIVRGLLDFSTISQLTMTEENLNSVIEQALVLLRHEIGHYRVKVTKQLPAYLPKLRLDRTKVEQVFVNLIQNAIHAMPGGGELTIQTGAFKPNGHTQIVAEVLDTGAGIPLETLPRIFDPFYTTKAPGTGTGLGLAVAKNIVEMHAGRLEIGNRPEGGVRAAVTFNV